MRKGLLAVAVAVLAAACGSEDTSSTNGMTDVTVGIVPFSSNAVLFLAMEKGMFTERGLNVSVEPAAAPVPIVASLVAGKNSFGFVTTPVLINANREGTPIQCVAPVDGQVSPDRDSSNLVVGADTGITSLRELAGRTVAVVQLSSLNSLGARKVIEAAGATGTEFVAMPFPQMPQALADGRVDAAVITAPYVETALDAGAVKLADPNQELFPNGTLFCYSATTRYLAENPEVARTFHDVMAEAILYTKDHEDEALDTLVEHLDLTPEQAREQVLPTNYVPEINLESISDVQDLMLEQGEIDDTVEPADLVWQPEG
jgi:NitT/TauT family transport system substrate-binding protein